MSFVSEEWAAILWNWLVKLSNFVSFIQTYLYKTNKRPVPPSKAFDAVNYDILLSKIGKYTRGCVSVDLFKSYLANYHTYVAIESYFDGLSGEYCSSRISTFCGVPQGSLLDLRFSSFVSTI